MEPKEGSYWNLIEPFFEAVDIYGDEASYLASIATLNRPSVLIYAAHFCLSELHNGGFLQFFWNSTGILKPEAVEGFRVIGMPTLASMLEIAAAPLGSPYPRDRDERWDALVAASKLESNELEDIFSKSDNLYLAFEKATESLGWDSLSQSAWELAETENGGFQAVADRYAVGIRPN